MVDAINTEHPLLITEINTVDAPSGMAHPNVSQDGVNINRRMMILTRLFLLKEQMKAFMVNKQVHTETELLFIGFLFGLE